MDILDEMGLRRVSNDLGAAVGLVALGVVLMVVDVRLGGFDVLNDVVGVGLVAWAAHRLLRLDVAEPGAVALRLARCVGLVTAGVVAVSEVVAPHTTTGIDADALVASTGHVVLLATRVAAQAATLVAAAVALGRVARWAGLARSARSWRTSVGLLGGLLVPATTVSLLLVAAHRAALVDVTARPAVSLVLLAAIYLSVGHVLVSLSRTGREAHAWRRVAKTG